MIKHETVEELRAYNREAQRKFKEKNPEAYKKYHKEYNKRYIELYGSFNKPKGIKNDKNIKS